MHSYGPFVYNGKMLLNSSEEISLKQSPRPLQLHGTVHTQTTWTRRILHGKPDAFNLRQFSRKPIQLLSDCRRNHLDRCIGLLLFNREMRQHTHTLCIDQERRGGWTHELCNDSVGDVRCNIRAGISSIFQIVVTLEKWSWSDESRR